MIKKTLIALLVLIVIGAGYVMYLNRAMFQKASSNNNQEAIVKETVAAQDLGVNNIIDPVVENELLFLLVGVDKNDDETDTLTRTDTMVLTKVNFDTGKISMISIPRDTRVEVQGQLDKINHAHAYGGMTLVMKTIRDFLGIDLDYYVKVNFESVKYIVDSIGGVQIQLNDQMAEVVGLSPGLQTLNGDQALEYIRFRYGYTSGDIGRVQAQQEFLKQVMQQTLKVENILLLPTLINTINDHVDTNIDLNQSLGYVKYVTKLDLNNIDTVTIPGTPQTIDSLWYYVPDMDGVHSIVDSYLPEYKIVN